MRRAQRALLLVILVAAPTLAYLTSFEGVFLFDDRPSIVDNPYIRTDAPWARPWQAMVAPRNITLSGRPVASLSFAVNYALARENVRGYHATNLAIHLISTLLLFGIARRTLGSTLAAWAIAGIWSVHPLTTGAVTYIVQRVESLMAMFLLLTLYCAIRAWQSKWWAVPAVVACALGMATKEAMVGAPLIVAAWDWTFSRKSFREMVRERWLLWAGLALTWVLLGMLVAMDARPLSSGFHFPAWPWTTYLATQAGVILHYLGLVFWPTPLILDYDVRPVATLSQAALPFVLLSITFVLSLWGFVRRSACGFAGVAFFVLLAPTSSVLPIVTEIAAEHRMYLPLAVVIAAVIGAALPRLHDEHAPARARVILFSVALGLMIPLGVATAARNRVYASDAGMWLDTVQKQPHNARARTNYALTLLQSGQSTAAAEQLQMAVADAPDFAEAHANLGVALATEGRVAEALPHFERALALNPFYTDVYEDIADAYSSTNRPADAVKYFIKALDQRPDEVALLNKAGWILATAIDPAARDPRQALVYAQHAVALTGRQDARSLDTLAAAYAEAGRWDEAIATGTEALAVARARGERGFPDVLVERLARYRAHLPIRM